MRNSPNLSLLQVVAVSLHSAIIDFTYVVVYKHKRQRLHSLEVNIIIYADGPSGIELGTLFVSPSPITPHPLLSYTLHKAAITFCRRLRSIGQTPSASHLRPPENSFL